MSGMQLGPLAVHFQIANLYSLATPPLWERSRERRSILFEILVQSASTITIRLDGGDPGSALMMEKRYGVYWNNFVLSDFDSVSHFSTRWQLCLGRSL